MRARGAGGKTSKVREVGIEVRSGSGDMDCVGGSVEAINLG